MIETNSRVNTAVRKLNAVTLFIARLLAKLNCKPEALGIPPGSLDAIKEALDIQLPQELQYENVAREFQLSEQKTLTVVTQAGRQILLPKEENLSKRSKTSTATTATATTGTPVIPLKPPERCLRPMRHPLR